MKSTRSPCLITYNCRGPRGRGGWNVSEPLLLGGTLQSETTHECLQPSADRTEATPFAIHLQWPMADSEKKWNNVLFSKFNTNSKFWRKSGNNSHRQRKRKSTWPMSEGPRCVAFFPLVSLWHLETFPGVVARVSSRVIVRKTSCASVLLGCRVLHRVESLCWVMRWSVHSAESAPLPRVVFLAERSI